MFLSRTLHAYYFQTECINSLLILKWQLWYRNMKTDSEIMRKWKNTCWFSSQLQSPNTTHSGGRTVYVKLRAKSYLFCLANKYPQNGISKSDGFSGQAEKYTIRCRCLMVKCLCDVVNYIPHTSSVPVAHWLAYQIHRNIHHVAHSRIKYSNKTREISGPILLNGTGQCRSLAPDLVSLSTCNWIGCLIFQTLSPGKCG